MDQNTKNAKNAEVVKLTKQIIDLKAEKKKYNSDMNESINDLESQIKTLCKEE